METEAKVGARVALAPWCLSCICHLDLLHDTGCDQGFTNGSVLAFLGSFCSKQVQYLTRHFHECAHDGRGQWRMCMTLHHGLLGSFCCNFGGRSGKGNDKVDGQKDGLLGKIISHVVNVLCVC